MAIQTEQIYGRREFHVDDISSWEGFEKICHFFGDLGAEVLSRNDGPDARVWKMKMNDVTISIVHDDMVGNFFFAEEIGGEPVASEMAAKLDERIRAMIQRPATVA